MSQNLVDSYRHKARRKRLLDGLRTKGIADEQVLNAMNEIPRHFFLDSAFDEIAYEDRAFPIEEDQTISQPYTVAFQTELLQIKPFNKVLEIGTGSAYQASVLAKLGALVFSIERQRKIFDKNKQFDFLKKMPSLKLFYGDGFLGLPTYGPFDRILITAAAPFVPQPLVQQLKVGGILVLPEGLGEVQTMKRITKVAEGELKEESFQQFSFVPMLEGRK